MRLLHWCDDAIAGARLLLRRRGTSLMCNRTASAVVRCMARGAPGEGSRTKHPRAARPEFSPRIRIRQALPRNLVASTGLQSGTRLQSSTGSSS